MNYKKLFGNKWLELRETEDGYTYSHDGPSAGDGHKVAVLVYNPGNHKILGRWEYTPCHQPGLKLVSITGSVEDGDPRATAVKELMEEAGIEAQAEELRDLGKVWPSKSSDTVCHLFVLPYRGEINEKPVGDGSVGEVGATVKWVDPIEAIASDDPLLPAMMGRLNLLVLNALKEMEASAK